MSAVSDILSAQQGAYEWRTRDCLTTTRALIEGLAGRRHAHRYGREIGTWHRLPEARAIASIREEFGGVGSAHAAGFGRHPAWFGVDVLPGDTPRQPGDIVQLAGAVIVMGNNWDTDKLGDLIGFVTNSCEIWHWAASGLAPASGDYRIERVFRCRRS